VAGGAAGAGLLTACGGGRKPAPEAQPVVTRADRLEGDLSVAALLVSLENLLVSVYQEGLDKKDKFGPYPPAVMSALDTALRQHKQHAVAWNGILTGAGKPGITGVDLTVKVATADPVLSRARDYNALLGLCQDLETLMSSTYLAAMGALENLAALKVAASIHPVENQHVGALGFLLGRALATDGFGRTDGARPTSDSIG
jgi:hypothetical protein